MLEVENLTQFLQSLKNDKQSADSHKATWDARREIWIKESNGEPYGNEIKGKASVVSRDIRRAEVWQHATIIDPFVSNEEMIKASPVTAEDEPIARQSSILLNHFYSRNFDRYNFISEAFKIEQREGTVVARIGWEFEEREVNVRVPVTKIQNIPTPQGIQQIEQIVGYRTEPRMETVINRPTAENRDNRTLWIDPTEKQNIENAQFVIEHFKSNLSKLKLDGIYENLDRVESFMDSTIEEDDYTYDDSEDDSFMFTDKARKEIDVYEYWGNFDINGDGIAEPIVCAWVGDVVIRLEENPYPDKKVPYISSAMDAEPFAIAGRPNADLLSVDQKISTSLLRSFMDTLDSSTNGQKGFREGTLDVANERKFNAGKNFKFQGDNFDVWEGKYSDINPSAINFYQLNQERQAELTGVRPFMGGANDYGSATAANMAMGAVAKRETDQSRNFANNFVLPMLRKWLAMISEFMEPEEVERITGEPYVPFDASDIGSKIDVRIEVNTAETDAARAADISFMLQTMAQSLPFDLTKILLAEQADLKKMPHLAKQIRAFTPKPDLMEQQMKMLEMQKIQVEIQERASRTQENSADYKLKEAKAINEQAKARITHADADIKDLDFVEKSTGADKKFEMEKEQQKIRGDLMKQAMSQRDKVSK